MSHARILASLLLFSAIPLLAQDISINDFRIPESRYQRLLGNLNGNYYQSRWGTPSRATHSSNGMLTASAEDYRGYSSESRSFTTTTSLAGTISRANSDYSGGSPTGLSSSDNAVESSDASFSGQYSSYLSPDEVYAFGDGHVLGSYRLDRQHDDTNHVRAQSMFNKTRTFNWAVGAGAGYGKMREASSVFAAVRILEKLQEDGYLTRDLTKDEILALVEVYAKRTEYSTTHERPSKYMLEDIFRELERRGLLKSDKDMAYEVARVAEVFQESILQRFVGWLVQAGIEVGRSGSESSYAQNYDPEPGIFTSSNVTDLVIDGQYGYAISLALHWFNEASLRFPVHGEQKRVSQYLRTSLYYQIGERVSNSLTVTYTKPNELIEGGPYSSQIFAGTQTYVTEELRYYIEDNVSIGLFVTYMDDVGENWTAGSSTRSTNGSIATSLGLRYRFF